MRPASNSAQGALPLPKPMRTSPQTPALTQGARKGRPAPSETHEGQPSNSRRKDPGPCETRGGCVAKTPYLSTVGHQPLAQQSKASAKSLKTPLVNAIRTRDIRTLKFLLRFRLDLNWYRRERNDPGHACDCCT